MSYWPRDELLAANAVAGRRLAAGGQLSGALHTLGCYSTDVCLGSPGRRFDLNRGHGLIDHSGAVQLVPPVRLTPLRARPGLL